MEMIKRTISANAYVLASVDGSSVRATKYYPNRVANMYSGPKEAVTRMLSFGNMGLRVFSEELARSLGIDYDVARSIATDLRTQLFPTQGA